MTIYKQLNIGASSTATYWSKINWIKVEAAVYRLQMRIAKAHRAEEAQ